MRWRRALPGCATLFLWLPVASAADLAAPREYEGRPIAGVRFDPVQQPVDRADLARLVTFAEGAPLHLDDVRAAIKRLYGTGRYSEIEVETEPAGNGVTLVIRTSEQWFVGPVSARGKVNSPPSTGQLADASRLDLGAPFLDSDLPAAVNHLQTLLQRNGLYRGTVEPKVERDPLHQQVSIVFDVRSGQRARLTTPAISGDARRDPGDVAKAAKYKGWFRWKQATRTETQAGVRNILNWYGKDDRLTAAVTIDHLDYLAAENRVRPAIRADGGPKIQIESSGAKVSHGTLKRYVPVFDEGTLNRDLLVRGARNLRDYFQNRGYFDVQVDFQRRQIDADHETITYVLVPGESHKLVRVDIKGNHYFTTDQIRERMFLQPAGFIRLRHGRFSEGFVKRDQESIEAMYRDNGFRDVKVTPTTADEHQAGAGAVSVTFAIDEGTQYLVAGIAVDGISRPDKDQIVARLACAPGQAFSETSVGIDRDYLLTLYQSSGYPDATFDWKMTQEPGVHEVQLRYTVTEGQPRFVRDVLISGLHTTRPRLTDPNILLKAGEPLSWTTMGEMQRRMYNLGVFEKVDMAIQNPDGDTEHKYVLYHLTEAHRYTLGVGLGAEFARIGGSQTSLDNPAGAAGFAPRGDLEVSRLNMWGLGQTLSFKGRYSTLDRRLGLTYLAPNYRNVEGRNISVSALYDNTRDVLTYTARRLEGSAQLTEKLSKTTTMLYRYTWRSVQVDQSTLKIDPLLIPLASQNARIAMVSTSLVYDRRDNPVNAHRGLYNSLDLGLAGTRFGGNRNFLRFLGRSSYYKPLHGGLVLASNTEFGWIHPFHITPGVDAFDYVPIPERFFGGGATSDRAFPNNQAGPRDAKTGFPIGGTALAFHSTELRFPLIGENIDGVLFHDIGNLFPGLDKITLRFRQKDLRDFDYLVHAAGFGIRYRTPVGPVRVDFAYSINPPRFNGLSGTYQQLLNGTATPGVQSISHFQFFFSIGQAF